APVLLDEEYGNRAGTGTGTGTGAAPRPADAGRAGLLDVAREERERVAPVRARGAPPDRGVECVDRAGVVTGLALRTEVRERGGEATGIVEQRIARPDGGEERRQGTIGCHAALERAHRVREVERVDRTAEIDTTDALEYPGHDPRQRPAAPESLAIADLEDRRRRQ